MMGYEDYLFTTIYGLNAISTILATVTVCLYFWLPNVQDLHGTCIFHYSLNIAILHSAGLYYWITNSSLLPETICFVELDMMVFVVTAINVWSIILSYNTWKHILQTGLVTVNSRRRLNYYRFIGYSIPFIYQVVVEKLHLSRERKYYYSTAHARHCFATFMMSLVIPIASSTFMNVAYFVDSQRQLGHLFARIAASENENSEDNRMILKRLSYILRLNLKLCTTMNIPFAISVILALFLSGNEFLTLLPVFLASLNGTLIFLVAVAFRKRVIKGFVEHAGEFGLGCLRPAIPSEVLGTEDDEEGTNRDEASAAEEDRDATAASQISPV